MLLFNCCLLVSLLVVTNLAWDKSFAILENDKKVIGARGWYPLNQNLPMKSELCKTKSEIDMKEERGLGYITKKHHHPKFERGFHTTQIITKCVCSFAVDFWIPHVVVVVAVRAISTTIPQIQTHSCHAKMNLFTPSPESNGLQQQASAEEVWFNICHFSFTISNIILPVSIDPHDTSSQLILFSCFPCLYHYFLYPSNKSLPK